MTNGHLPVLCVELVAALAPTAGDLIVDGTFGRGGHARALLAAAACRIVAIDRDPDAVAAAADLTAAFPDRLAVRLGRFADMEALVGEPADGVALDLGVSSPQLDDPARGFSFRFDAPLDMRMERAGSTAADLVNHLPEAELAAMIRELGEERHARRVARAIVAARPIARTGRLAEVVRSAVPRSRDGIDPATRTFQALRLQVNDELGELSRGLCAAERLLKPGGRLAVISFHSLEDRRVKRFLGRRAGAAGRGSRHLPGSAAERRPPSFRLVQRRPVAPSDQEIAANPRARSARLRAAVRTAAPAWPADVEEGA